MTTFTNDTTPLTATIVVAATSERAAALAAAGISLEGELAEDAGATKYEYHNNHDYMCIRALHKDNLQAEPSHIEAYLTKTALCVLSDSEDFISAFAAQIKQLACGNSMPSWALYQLLTLVLSRDGQFIEDLEDKIDAIEEETTQTQPENINELLMDMRKNLLILKRYYEALFDLLEDLEENQNSFLPKPMLRNFRLHTNRVSRLLNSVINLRDYLGHVRELYQNQIDIRLNRTMQLLTVITVIFMPLTLIVGWFGMNLQMPEYAWPYTYPVVGVASVVIIIFCLWYFKKKDWF